MHIRARVGSVRYAWRGIRVAWREEPNFRLQSYAALSVFLAAWLFRVSRTEWLVLALTIGLVLVAELINTSFEELCDMYKTEEDPHIAKIKDIAAGAVYLAALISVLIGSFIFLPRLWALFF